MKAYLVTKLTYFLGNAMVDSFHYTMFHGLAERTDEPDKRLASYMMEDHLRYPLHLLLNGFRKNQIFQPNLNLIVSESVAGSLRKYPNIALLQTVVDKVANISYSEGEFRHWEDPNYRDSGDDPARILREHAQTPSSTPLSLNFWELICHDYTKIHQSYPEAADLSVPVGPTEFDDPFEARLSERMLREYPIIWHHAGILFNEEAFGDIEAHLNMEYFLVTVVDMRQPTGH